MNINENIQYTTYYSTLSLPISGEYQGIVVITCEEVRHRVLLRGQSGPCLASPTPLLSLELCYRHALDISALRDDYYRPEVY